MPADFDDYFRTFADLTGTAGESIDFFGKDNQWHEIGDVNYWINLFEETGIDFDDTEDQTDAFGSFLVAFYPVPGETMAPDEWFYIRQEFYYQYGLSDQDIDWEDYREAIGYGRS